VTEDQKEYLRRAMDEQFSKQLSKNTDRLDDILSRLQAVEQRLTTHEERLVAAAVYQAEKALLGRFGVDVDSPESVDGFRRGLQFGRAMHGTMTKAAWAFVAAFCSGMGTAMLLVIHKVFFREVGG
jgi:uncharacterized membrane protein affecting hemolysin expression